MFKYINEESTNLNANKNIIKNSYINIKFYKYYINIYKKKKKILIIILILLKLYIILLKSKYIHMYIYCIIHILLNLF